MKRENVYDSINIPQFLIGLALGIVLITLIIVIVMFYSLQETKSSADKTVKQVSETIKELDR